MSNVSVPEAREKLRSHFSTFQGDSDTYGKGWDELWRKGDFLPWDRFAPSPALVDTLENHHSLIGNHDVDGRRKKALVPGCGRGVDVLLLESYGYDVVGLEYSTKAVEECEKFAKERGAEYETKVAGGSRKFVQGDFYKEDWLERVGMTKGETFDLIYDYTFFCAMQLSMRPAWAQRMADLLGPSLHANLVCLEFPTTKEAGTGGPPFASPSTAYVEHLSHPGEDVQYNADSTVKSNPLRPASAGGLERVGHWTPKDTHAIGKGEDGTVKDRVAVWRHR